MIGYSSIFGLLRLEGYSVALASLAIKSFFVSVDLCLDKETQAPPLPDCFVIKAIPGSVCFTVKRSSSNCLGSSDFFLIILRLVIGSEGRLHLNWDSND
jgi:hypothetical protein